MLHNTWRGYSLLCAALLAAVSPLYSPTLVLAGAIIWLTVLSASAVLPRRARNQSLGLLLLGLIGMFYSLLYGASISWLKLVQSNTVLLSMLYAVSFLSLVASPNATSKQRRLPTGRRGLLSTLLATHLFGAIINISSVIMVGERLKAYRAIDLPLARSLSVAFGLCALWSPFFASMAYTMALVPGMDLYTVMLMGMPISALGIALLYWQSRHTAAGLTGYPLQGRSLVLPSVLALIVIGAHELWPHWPIPIIIVIASLCIVNLILLLERRWHLAYQHCQQQLGNHTSTSAIFLAAGVFATGLGQLLQVMPISLPFADYGPSQASLVLFFSLVAARLGVHAIIIMAILNPLLSTLNPPANLLAMTYLAIWGIGMSINPVSGTLLTIQGQFGIKGSHLARTNLGLTGLLYGLVCGAFFLYSI